MRSHIATNYKLLYNSGSKIIIKRARGVYLYDCNGRAYIDGTSSYCSANFGHGNTSFKRVINQQLANISVCPRFVESKSLSILASTVNKYFHEKLNIKHGEHLQILPSTNGVDTVETAIKLARAWGFYQKQIPMGKSVQIFFSGNFHGRSISAISVSDYPYQIKFYPPNPNLIKLPYNSIYALELYLESNPNVSGVFLEPIQCEGGIIIPNPEYLKKVRTLCDKYNILMICDEIQTGMFRTGPLLSVCNSNVKPDVVLVGKSLGGGILPISLCVSSNKIMEGIKPGEHGSTFGGYPLASSLASYVLDWSHAKHFESTVNKKAFSYATELGYLRTKYSFIKAIRQSGLMIGIELDDSIDPDKVSEKLTQFGIIIKSTNNNTLRLSPPFIIKPSETAQILDGLNRVFADE
jgi:ornithine--oxo-acid transaminase